MTILVTGCAGFIGMHTCLELLKRGHRVVGLDNLNDYYDVSLKQDRLSEIQRISDDSTFIFHKVDIKEAQKLTRVFEQEKIDAVIHLAAQAGVRYSKEFPSQTIESNILGFMNVLDNCVNAEIQHLVYASSSSVYGANQKIPYAVTDGVDHPVSIYAATKKSNELMAHVYSDMYQLPTTGLRFFTVYGPWGRPDMSPMLFAKNINSGMPIKVFNHGQHSRDFTYIDDIVKAVVDVMEVPATTNQSWNAEKPDPSSSHAPWRVYNIGNEKPVELMTYISEIESALDKKAIIEFLPKQDGDVERTWSDTSDLERLVGFKPETELSEGIVKFIRWYKSYFE